MNMRELGGPCDRLQQARVVDASSDKKKKRALEQQAYIGNDSYYSILGVILG